MKILSEAHRYELENFENRDKIGQIIQFIEKDKINNIFVTIHDGTTNEEILAVLIDRLNCLNKKFPCRENSIVITKLEESLMWLNKRTADRVVRNVEGKPLA